MAFCLPGSGAKAQFREESGVVEHHQRLLA